MAMNAAEAWQMLACSREHPNLVAMVVPAPFTLELDRTVKRKLDEGFIGSVLAVDLRAQQVLLSTAISAALAPGCALERLERAHPGIWYECAPGGSVTRALFGPWPGPSPDSRKDSATGAPVRVEVPDHVDVLARWNRAAASACR